MMRIPHSFVTHAAILAALLISMIPIHAAETSAPPKKQRYIEDVAKLAAAPAPAPGGILMVGSSIFRKWTSCAQDLAPLPVTNRGFGGSRTADQLFFFDQIVPSSRASLVVWYCGSNDVNGKKTPEEILKNTKEWIGRTQAALPQAHILVVSVIRAPQKREDGKLPQVDEVNQGLLDLTGSIKRVDYIDVNPALETPAGEPVPECYGEDHLHLTPEGYRRMVMVLKPMMETKWKTAPALNSLPTP
jgi:lysophospholipase L1-like esterase